MNDPLSYERIKEARETLTAAFRLSLDGKFHGAVQCADPSGVFCEAKRNLTALVQHLHGQEAFEKILGED